MQKINLKKSKDKSLIRKHPWVFSGAIRDIDSGISEGSVVEIYDCNDNFIATGHYQPGTISVRVLSFDREEINEDFWKRKIFSAINKREQLGFFDNPDINVFRLINSEGDGLSGLIADYYNGNLVIQAHSAGMLLNMELFKKIFLHYLGNNIKSIINRSSTTISFKSAIKTIDEVIYGNPGDGRIKVTENGIDFFVDILEGQKSGFFIDQRDNRKLLKKYSEGRKVLNTFCYSGGFSIYALKGGADEVTSIDSSRKAIELLEKNILINRLENKNHNMEVADVFDFFKNNKSKYDLIVLDPPAFAKHINSLNRGLQGYFNLNRLALSCLAKNGILFTFSCSQVVTKEDFKKIVFKAALNTEREVSIIHHLSQSADHPINIYHPEGEYLKGLVLHSG